MKRLGLVICLFFSFLSARAQNPELIMTPQVVGSNLEISLQIFNGTGAEFSMGPFDIPITLDTIGLDIANMSVVQGEFGEPNTTYYDSVQAVMITNNVMNVAVRPDYISNDPSDDTDPQQRVEINTFADIATLVIPILDCKPDLMLDWVPPTNVLGGARLDWLGNDLEPIDRTPVVSPFPVTANTLVVSNNDDSGCGSLRNAIETANNNPGPDVIDMSPFMSTYVPGTNDIQISTPLEFTDDSTSFFFGAGTGCDTKVTILPDVVNDFDGFVLTSVQGIELTNFNIRNFINGVYIDGGSNNIIQCNYIGTNFDGTAPAGNNVGVHIYNSSSNLIGDSTNTARGNLISGNNADGVFIEEDSPFNFIGSNRIGTNAAGTAAIGNGGNGIFIDGAGENEIGGATARVGNIISGNGENGIELDGSSRNSIYHNFIGTAVGGVIGLGNLGNGVEVNNFSNNNFIGDSVNTSGNVISGNRGDGVSISLSNDNLVAGNVIGMGLNGLLPIPNNKGVFVQAQSDGTIVGNSLSSGGGNLISGNNDNGIHVFGGSNTTIARNYIGLDTNTAAAPNGASNLLINASQTYVQFNVIAFAPSHGIQVSGLITSTANLWGVNSIYSNDGEGISFDNTTVQNSIDRPTIVYSNGMLQGTAENNAIIQIYADSSDEGQIYLDTTMADGSGDWEKTLPLALLQSQVAAGRTFLTAVQTDPVTFVSSEFSIPLEICIPPIADIQHPTDPDWTFCVGDTLDITSDFVAGATYSFYMESTNTAVINVTDSTASLVEADFASSPGTDNLIVEVETSPSGCLSRDTVQININSEPVAQIVSAPSVCETGTLDVTTTAASNPGTWGTTGDGVFDDVSADPAQYSPGANDITNGATKIYFTTTPGICSSRADTVNITVFPAPTIDVGSDQTICAGDSALVRAVTTGSGINWSTAVITDGDFVTPPGITADSAIYVPSANDILNGSVTIVGAIPGSVSCPGPFSDDMVLTIVPAQQVDAGPDTIACLPINIDLVATAFPGYQYTWTRQGGGFSTGPTIDEDTVSVSAAGKYFVESESSTGSCYSIDSVTVTENPSMVDPNVVFFDANSNSVTFAWDSVVGAINYTLTIDTCRYPNIAGPCTALAPVSFPNNGPFRYTQTGLTVGDSVNFTVVANDGCGGMTNPMSASGVADSCNALFSGLESSYCTASFLDYIYPEFEGGVFTASPVPSALKFTGTQYYFDPAEAGPGDHWIYYENCSGSRDSAMTTVFEAPCVTDVVNDSTASAIENPQGLYTDCDGQIYASSGDKNIIVKIDTFGVASVVAGDSTTSGNADGPVATAKVNAPVGIVVMPDGTVYFANSGNHTIRRVSGGVVTTVAGSGSYGDGTLADDGLGTAARFRAPYGLALSKDLSTLYVTDEHRLRSVDLTTFQVTTLAGTGSTGSSNGNGTNTRFFNPSHVATDGSFVYVTDRDNSKIRSYDIVTGITADFAFSGSAFPDAEGYKFDVDSPEPRGISVDENGAIFVADAGSNTINRVEDDTSSIFAGDYYTAGDAQGSAANARFNGPDGLSVFAKGFLDVSDAGNNKIKRIAINDFLKSPLRELDSGYCQGEPVDTLASNTAIGTYSGTGISDNGTHWVFNPNTPGTYDICYEYEIGYCTENLCFEVTVAPNPTVDLGPDTTIICSDQFNTDSLKVDSTFDRIDWRVNNVLDPGDEWYRIIDQAPARYTVAIEDTNGCIASDTVDVILSRAIVDAGATPVEICALTNDTISDATINGSLNTPTGYTVAWSPSVGINRVDTLHPVVNYTDTTLITYYLSVTDTVGCVDTDSIKYTINESPTVTASPFDGTTAVPSDTILCLGSSQRLVAEAVSTGWAIVDPFAWTPTTSLSNANVQAPEATPIDTTTYTILFTDINGCTAVDSVTLYPQTLSPDLTFSKDTACFEEDITVTAGQTGGVGPYVYSWDNGVTYDVINSITVSPQADTLITLFVYDSASACEEFVDSILVVSDLAVTFAEDSLEICYLDSAAIDATINGATIFTVNWNGPGIIDGPLDEDPIVQPSAIGGSFFTVEVTDAANCSVSDSVYVNRLAPLGVDANSTTLSDTILCLGNTVGLAASPNPPATWALVNPFVWSPSTGLSASNVQTPDATPSDTTTYTVTFTDINGCTANDSVTLYPKTLTPDLTFSKDTACFEEDITVTAGQTGGVGPYVYSWDNGVTYDVINSITVSPQADTTITVFVYDSASACEEFVDSDLVVSDLAVTFAEDSLEVCYNDVTSIETTISGGIAPYTTAWTGGNVISSPSDEDPQVQPVAAGGVFYYVQITDNGTSGCVLNDSVYVNRKPPLAVQASVVPAEDSIFCLNSIVNLTAVAVPASAGGTYSWRSSDPTVIPSIQSPSVTPLDTITVYAQYTDADNCVSTEDSVTLYPQTISPTITFSKDTACFEESITVTASQEGGIGPFVYSWDGGTNYDVINNISVTPQADTTLVLYVYDSTSKCEEFIDSVLVVSDLAIAFADDSVGVCFDSLASVEALASGGKPGYSFAWTGPGTIASPGNQVTDITTAATGTGETYTVTVTDQPIGTSLTGCTATGDVVVYMNTEVVVEAGTDTTICAGNPVTRIATASGGQGPYTFGWTDGGTFNLPGATLNVSPTDSTVYYLGGRDVYNCPGIDSVAVNVVNPQIDVITQFNNFCPGTRDSVYVDLTTPGSGNYEYSFDGGTTFGPNAFVILFPTMDTTVNAILRDVTGGCELNGSVDIDVQEFTVDLGDDKALCWEGSIDPNTGMQGINVRPTIVGGSAPIDTTWSVIPGPATMIDIVQNGLNDWTITADNVDDAVHEYVLTLEDAAGCIVRDTLGIYYPNNLISFAAPLTSFGEFTICDGDTVYLGSTIPTEGGVPPYRINWEAPGTNVDNSILDAPFFASDGQGEYYFTKTVFDSIGCESRYFGGANNSDSSNIVKVTVIESPPIDFEVDGMSVAPNDTVSYCEGPAGFEIRNIAPGASAVSHEWRYPGSTGGVISMDVFTTDNQEGFYFLRVEDATCFREASLYMSEIPLATVTIDPIAGPVCDNEPIIVTATATPTGGTYSWTSDGSGTIQELDAVGDSIAYTIDATDASPITFNVTYNAGCNDAPATPVAATYNVSPTAGLEFSTTSLLPTDTIMVMDTSTYPNGYAGSEYFFQNGIQNGVANENATGTLGFGDFFEVRWDDPGTFNVCIEVTETTGCSDSLCVPVNVIGSELFYIPNVISPQASNSENQVAKVYGPSLIGDNFKFEVYNRWGELIFETGDFVMMNTIGWNGLNQNTGVIEVNGVYTYRADLSFEGGATTQATGTITIVK